MDTAEKKVGAQGANAKANRTANKTENRPNLTGKEAKQNGTAKDEKQSKASEFEAGETAETKTGSATTVGNQPANVEQPEKEAVNNETAEGTKADAQAEVKYIKPVLNLEQTLKSIGDLNRLSIQRLALIGRIKLLEDFEVKLIEEGDELSSNPYNNCRLIIRDDKGREFTTNTPNLIRMVSQFIFNACHDKLAEIEANIVFPNA